MELVAAHARANLHERRRSQRLDLSITDGQTLALHPRRNWEHTEHGVSLAVEGGQRLAQRHQPTALGVDRTSTLHKVVQGRPHRLVVREFLRAQLWETAAQVQALARRRWTGIFQGREGHDLGSTFGKEVDRVLVVEAKRRILSHTNS